MRAEQEGETLRTKKTLKTQHFIIPLSLLIGFFALIVCSPAHAQSVKPQLTLVELNEQTNDEEALGIAKRLLPNFFSVNQNTFENAPVFYASFAKLQPENPKRFIIVTAQESLYYCTNHGCPIYVFYNMSDNKWVQVLSVQTHSMFYDVSTDGIKPRNIITVGNEMAQRKLKVWFWNGMTYEEVSTN